MPTTSTFWTPERDQLVIDNYNKLTVPQLAKVLKEQTGEGVSITRIRKRATRYLGLKLSPERVKEIQRDNAFNTTAGKLRMRGPHPYPGASIYTITYFAYARHMERQDTIHLPNPTFKYVDLLSDVAEALDISVDDLKGNSSKRNLVYARYIFCYVAMKLFKKASQIKLAKILGYSDHTAITRGLSVMNTMLKDKKTIFVDKKLLATWHLYLKNTKVYKRHARTAV